MSNMTCLVTGGTKGLGAAVVEEMAALGAKVVAIENNHRLYLRLHARLHILFNPVPRMPSSRCLYVHETPKSCRTSCRHGRPRVGQLRDVQQMCLCMMTVCVSSTRYGFCWVVHGGGCCKASCASSHIHIHACSHMHTLRTHHFFTATV